jgi:mannose-6-phosphate isomerase-like protein (cupin superfamily)
MDGDPVHEIELHQLGVRTKRTAPRSRWREVCESWSFAASHDLNVMLERMPPATHELRHKHEMTRQFYYLLQGTATVEVADTMVQIRTGAGIEIAPQTPHRIRNDSDKAIEFLVVSSGPPREDRRDLEA